MKFLDTNSCQENLVIWKILQTLRKHFCQLKLFSEFQRKLSFKSEKKNEKFSEGEIGSAESFWHVEISFDSFAWNFSQTFCNIFALNPKTFEKLYTFRKNFHSIKFSHRNINFRFDHAVKRYSSKYQAYVRYGPKIIRRPILSEKNSSKSSWRYLENNVVNGALVFWTKNPKTFV